MTRILVFLALLLPIAACGIKGDPVPPPGPDGQARPSAVPVGAAAPATGEARLNRAAPDRPFVLDGLLN